MANVFAYEVEVTGLEPAASWSQTKHSTKLSYTPIDPPEGRADFSLRGGGHRPHKKPFLYGEEP